MMLSRLLRAWYQTKLVLLTRLLLPLSYIFGVIVAVRRYAYRHHWLHCGKLPIPVIVIGNLTVGGTGKTPLLISLVVLLRQHGYKPAVISRGYGSQFHGLTVVTPQDDPKKVGDEPLLIAQRAQCPVVIAKKRLQAAEYVLNHFDCDIILSDDGLQHYALARDIEIAVVDAVRQFGNQQLLPAGPLREPMTRLSQVDFVVFNGYEASEYSMHLQAASMLTQLKTGQQSPLTDFKKQTVHAVAGIGHPQRFFDTLQNIGLSIIAHPFADHYSFRHNDLEFGDDLAVVMTEKDAVKCRDIASNKHWYLPVDAKLSDNFITALFETIRQLEKR